MKFYITSKKFLEDEKDTSFGNSIEFIISEDDKLCGFIKIRVPWKIKDSHEIGKIKVDINIDDNKLDSNGKVLKDRDEVINLIKTLYEKNDYVLNESYKNWRRDFGIDNCFETFDKESCTAKDLYEDVLSKIISILNYNFTTEELRTKVEDLKSLLKDFEKELEDTNELLSSFDPKFKKINFSKKNFSDIKLPVRVRNSKE